LTGLRVALRHTVQWLEWETADLRQRPGEFQVEFGCRSSLDMSREILCSNG